MAGFFNTRTARVECGLKWFGVAYWYSKIQFARVGVPPTLVYIVLRWWVRTEKLREDGEVVQQLC